MKNSVTKKYVIKNEHNELLCGFKNIAYGVQEPIWANFGEVLAMSGETAKVAMDKINKKAGKVTAHMMTITE